MGVMDLRQLANFVRIVDAGSITRAAGIVGIAQPALTFQIARLEEEIGAKLLVRSARGVKPTEGGLVLYRHARIMLRQAEQIPALVREGAGQLAGEVTVGFTTSLSPIFAGPLVEASRARFPRLRLRIVEGESALLKEFALNNRVDMAIVAEFAPRDELTRVALFRQRLGLLARVPARRARTAPKDIALADALAQATLISGPGNPVRAALDAAMRSAGISKLPVVELNSMQATVTAVAQGLGPAITVMAPLVWHAAHAELAFRPIVDPEMHLDMSLCRSKTAVAGPAAEAIEHVLVGIVEERIGRPDWAPAISKPSAS